MKKIRLDLDRLAVDSFSTTRDGAPRIGTVRGHVTEPDPISLPPTEGEACNPQSQHCGTYDTNCYASCYGTCHEVSCVPSCALTCPDPIGPAPTG